MKTPVVLKEDYKIYFELYMDLIFVHSDVFRWNKAVKGAFLKDSDDVVRLLNTPVYAYHVVGDDKHLKFLKLNKFYLVREGLSDKGELLQIYKKEIPDGS